MAIEEIWVGKTMQRNLLIPIMLCFIWGNTKLRYWDKLVEG